MSEVLYDRHVVAIGSKRTPEATHVFARAGSEIHLKAATTNNVPLSISDAKNLRRGLSRLIREAQVAASEVSDADDNMKESTP